MAKKKKATTIDEFINNFNPIEPIGEDNKDFYVEIYEKLLNRLKRYILTTQNPQQTYFLTGQKGSGKTSALKKLQDLLKTKFNIVTLNARDYDIEDTDIVDLLLLIGSKIIKNSGDKELEKKYLQELDELQEKNKKEIFNEQAEVKKIEGETGLKAEAGIKVPTPFKFLAAGFDIFAQLSIDKEVKSIVRESFRIIKYDLAQKINDIIDNVNKNGKKILLLLDDLEKLVSHDSIKNIFRENIRLLTDLNCIKVILYPLTEHEHIVNINTNLPPLFFSLRITNPPEQYENEPDETALKTIDLFKQVIKKRIDNNKLDDLITQESIDLAIKYSGGNLRQLIQILYNAAFEAYDTDKITKTHINSAISLLRQPLSFAIKEQEKIKILHNIYINKFPQEKEADFFNDAILHNFVFFYYNGDIWYDVNPLIESTVKERIKLMKNNG